MMYFIYDLFREQGDTRSGSEHFININLPEKIMSNPMVETWYITYTYCYSGKIAYYYYYY